MKSRILFEQEKLNLRPFLIYWGCIFVGYIIFDFVFEILFGMINKTVGFLDTVTNYLATDLRIYRKLVLSFIFALFIFILLRVLKKRS